MEFWWKGPIKGWICKRPRKQNKIEKSLKRKADHDDAEEKRLKKKENNDLTIFFLIYNKYLFLD